MNILKQILILFLFLISIKSFSQVSNYTFSQSLGTYTPITGGVNISNFTNWNNTLYTGTLPNTVNGFWDDNVSAALLPIGFNFVYNGTNYTQFGVSTNGWLSLGTIPTSSSFPLSIGTSNNVISAAGRDLIGRGSLTGNRTNGSTVITITAGDISQILVGDKVSGNGIPNNATVVSKTATTVTISAAATSTGNGFHFRFSNPNFGIRYQTIGTAPNRTLVVQWTGFQRYTTSGTFGELYNFQIRLNETTNVINVVYSFQGPTSTTSTTFEIGLRGNSNADFNNRTTTSNWSSTTAGSSNSSTITLTNTVRPTSGLTYTWTPPSCIAPSLLTSSSVTSTTATISWTAPSNPPASYDYFLSTTNVAPTAGTTPTGNTTSTSVNLTSLTPNTRYYWWVRSNCGGIQSTWNGSANFYTGIPTCTNTIQYPNTSVSAGIDNLPITIDNCNYQEEYAVVSGIVAGNTYQFGYSRGGWITIRINTFNGTAVIAGNAPLTWTATISGNVFVHYNTDDFCGTATICGTSTVTCTSCPPPIPGCTNIYQYITANAPTTNIPLTLANNQWQDEFNEINNVVAGATYESSYSLGGFITIRVGTYNGSVVASGNSPLTWTAPSSGTYYIHYNTDNSCNNATINGTSILTCTSCAGVPPANDLICNAISINCNTSTNGTTIDATNTGTGENQTCGYIQTQPGVWYVIDGDGGTMIASLCNTTTWDSKISIFSGTNCNNTTCFSGNDDAIDCGGIEASDTFTTVINRKYFILVHGYNSNDNFTLNVSCRPDLLPIKWKSFNGETDNEINYLRWVTEMEEDTDYFEVEKSENGIDFESISIINAANNSLTDKTYNYNDENPYIGQNYYRIKLYNLDGSFEYSNIIVLNVSKNDKYHIYPNPFDNTITYSYINDKQETLNVEIINLLGQTIYNKIEACTNKLIISLNDLTSGSYKIKIRHLERGYVIEEFIIKK